MIYANEERWGLFHGDCLDVMRGMADASVDAVVSDPPYGLSFMGKAWDHGVPGEPFWAEALRVAKPGAHLLAFGGTRTFHRLAVAIEDAGWEIRDDVLRLMSQDEGFRALWDTLNAAQQHALAEVLNQHGMGGCLAWNYGTGFPKSHNLDGAWDGWGTALKPAWEPIIVARKPVVGTVKANVEAFGTGALNVDGCRIGTTKQVPGGVSSQSRNLYGAFRSGDSDENDGHDANVGRWPANVILDEELDPVLCLRDSALEPLFRSVYAGFDSVRSVWCPVGGAAVAAQAVAVLHEALLRRVAEREQVGREPPHAREAAQRSSDREDVESAEGARAGRSEGEHVEGRPVQVARVHDVGGLCVERGGPVAGRTDDSGGARIRARTSAGDGAAAGASAEVYGNRASPERPEVGQQAGELGVDRRSGAQARSFDGSRGAACSESGDRRPSFCVAESDVPEVWREHFVESGRVIRTGSAAALDAQSGERPGMKPARLRRGSTTGRGMGFQSSDAQDAGVLGRGDSGGASRFFYVAKASRSERNAGLEGFPEALPVAANGSPNAVGTTRGSLSQPRANAHPTVKPVAVMAWLCRLVTPPNGLVLDPFTGSGTTGVAALREGFNFIGIEREAQYVEIARARIAHEGAR